MMQRIPVSSIPPDLRFGLAAVWADGAAAPPIGGIAMHVTGELPATPVTPAYLRYSDRDAEVVIFSTSDPVPLEQKLADHVRLVGESYLLDDLSVAVVVLAAVDQCFREAGLWPGNIYLAGAQALANLAEICGRAVRLSREPLTVMRELAALELAYLFPIAGKFRSGRYDRRVQYRLNGWGRALADRLASGPAGTARAQVLKDVIGQHLATEADQYQSFLRQLDVARQDYDGDLLDVALALPIPVLV
jgi:hypothetical protein